MKLPSALIVMVSALWFGGTLFYFISFMRKNGGYEISLVKFIAMVFQDVRFVTHFYSAFYRTHRDRKGRGIGALTLIISHILSPVVFWVVAIVDYATY